MRLCNHINSCSHWAAMWYVTPLTTMQQSCCLIPHPCLCGNILRAALWVRDVQLAIYLGKGPKPQTFWIWIQKVIFHNLQLRDKSLEKLFLLSQNDTRYIELAVFQELCIKGILGHNPNSPETRKTEALQWAHPQSKLSKQYTCSSI